MVKEKDVFFIPSEELARQIGEAQLRQTRVKIRWPWTSTNRLDVTSTEAPTSAREPLSVFRTRQAIKERFGRLLASVGTKAREFKIDNVSITTPIALSQRFGHALARDFGFDDTSAHVIWSAAFAEELRAWLSTFPNKRKTFGFGTLVVEDDGSIALLPNQQKS